VYSVCGKIKIKNSEIAKTYYEKRKTRAGPGFENRF